MALKRSKYGPPDDVFFKTEKFKLLIQALKEILLEISFSEEMRTS